MTRIEAWIAKWKIQEDYRIRCQAAEEQTRSDAEQIDAMQERITLRIDQIARLRESLESCVERIVSDIGPSAGEAAAALIVLKETAP